MLNYVIILAVLFLSSILKFIANLNCVFDSCDISACQQIIEDSHSDFEPVESFHNRSDVMVVGGFSNSKDESILNSLEALYLVTFMFIN